MKNKTPKRHGKLAVVIGYSVDTVPKVDSDADVVVVNARTLTQSSDSPIMAP